MSLSALRRAAPWIVGPIAVGALLLGGLPVVAIAVGLLLIAALLGHAIARARHVGMATGRRATIASAGAGGIWALVASVALATVADQHGIHRPFDLGLPASPLLARGMRMSAAFLDLLVAAAAVSSGVAIRALSAPGELGGPPSADALRAAATIVSEYGTDSLAPFAVRPDKSLAFAAGGFVAYRVIGDVVVVSADPVGPEGSTGVVLAALLARARAARLHVALYAGSHGELEVYRGLGLHALCVGEEAVVDPRQFTLDGRPVRKLRQSVHRIERRGWQVSARRGRDVDAALEAEIDAVEQAWRAAHARMLGFAMSLGEFQSGVHCDDLYLLARSPAGELQAVMRFIDHRGNLSLDTMRRVGETPNGLNEALICHALAYARETEIAEVSLNYAGFAHMIRHTPTGGRARRGATRVFLRVLSGRFQMDRLVLFNEKFSPQWRPRYLVYDSRLALPRVTMRVLQAEGYLPEWRRRWAGARRNASRHAAQRCGR